MNHRRDVPDDDFPCGRRGRQPRDKGKRFIRQRAYARFVFQENFRKAASSAACRKTVYRIIPTRLYPYPLGSAFGRGFRTFRLRFTLRRDEMPVHNTLQPRIPTVESEECIGSFDTLKIYNRRLRCAGVYPLPTAVVGSLGPRFGSILMSERRVSPESGDPNHGCRGVEVCDRVPELPRLFFRSEGNGVRHGTCSFPGSPGRE